MTQRCGFVAVVGAPNAGKSTLVNALIGQKVAIVSPKAQTTRTRLIGVAIAEQSQILLVDTPGIFEPRRRLDRAMVAAAWGGAQDADLIAFVIDAKTGITNRIADLLDRLAERREPKILVLNKVDTLDEELIAALSAELAEASGMPVFPLSAAGEIGIEPVLDALMERIDAEFVDDDGPAEPIEWSPL